MKREICRKLFAVTVAERFNPVKFSIIYIYQPGTSHFIYKANLCLLYDYRNKHRFFQYAELTDSIYT
jgi:hypothetical protein